MVRENRHCGEFSTICIQQDSKALCVDCSGCLIVSIKFFVLNIKNILHIQLAICRSELRKCVYIWNRNGKPKSHIHVNLVLNTHIIVSYKTAMDMLPTKT